MWSPAAEPEVRPPLVQRLLFGTPPSWALLLLLTIALMIRGRFMLSQNHLLAADPDGYAVVAWSIGNEGTIGFQWGRRPTATRPPLFPAVLGIFSIAELDASIFCGPLHVIFGTATVWGTWRLGRLWKLPPGAAILAAGLVTIDPILLAQSVQLMTETLAALLAVLTLICVTRFAEAPALRWTLAAGAVGGLCILCRPEFAVWLGMMLLVFPFFAAGRFRGLRLVTCAASVAVVVAPWAVRNLTLFDRPVVTTTHGGFTLLLANNPEFYEYLRSAPWGTVWDGAAIYERWSQHEEASPRVLLTTLLREREVYDEVGNDRWAYQQAFEAIRAEPVMFAYSCLVRMGRLWSLLPHQVSEAESPGRRGLRYAVGIWYLFEFALAAWGAWLLRAKLFRAPWIWGTLLVLSITAVHAFYWTDMRMRAPLVPVIALAAAVGLATLACGKRDASALEASP